MLQFVILFETQVWTRHNKTKARIATLLFPNACAVADVLALPNGKWQNHWPIMFLFVYAHGKNSQETFLETAPLQWQRFQLINSCAHHANAATSRHLFRWSFSADPLGLSTRALRQGDDAPSVHLSRLGNRQHCTTFGLRNVTLPARWVLTSSKVTHAETSHWSCATTSKALQIIESRG